MYPDSFRAQIVTLLSEAERLRDAMYALSLKTGTTIKTPLETAVERINAVIFQLQDAYEAARKADIRK